MFPTAGPLGFPLGTASRMLVLKVDLRLKRSMSASGTDRKCTAKLTMSVDRSKADLALGRVEVRWVPLIYINCPLGECRSLPHPEEFIGR
jgi:hypothetical protein